MFYPNTFSLSRQMGKTMTVGMIQIKVGQRLSAGADDDGAKVELR
jgi:hypothetical protein